MKNSFSLETYVCTFIIRTLWSSLIVLTAIIGLSIVTANATGNNFKMEKANHDFEVLFFSITAGLEVLAAIFYVLLWLRQRGKENIQSINTCDCRSTCFFILVRLGWTIALSILVLLQAGELEHIRGYSQRYNTARAREWGAIEHVTLVLMIFEVAYIIGIVCGLLYQPDDFQREIHFDSLQNILSDGGYGNNGQTSSVVPNRGVIPENHAQKKIEEMRRNKLQQKIDNLNRLKKVRQQQRYNHIKKADRLQFEETQFQFKTYNRMNQDKKFMRNFKEVDDNNIAGHAVVDDAYQQFLNFKEEQRKREEDEQEIKRNSNGLNNFFGTKSKANAKQVFNENNFRNQGSDVLGGNNKDLPAHEILPSLGRQSSLSSHHNKEAFDYEGQEEKSPEISLGQLGHQVLQKRK